MVIVTTQFIVILLFLFLILFILQYANMGNCFASKQKEKSSLYVQVPVKKATRQPAKVKDYLKYQTKGLRIDSYDINTTNHPCFVQISKDIDRTYPNQQFFKITANKVAFERVLKRIALHYPKLGYTQGINFVAGYFLLDGITQIQAYKSFAAMLVDPEAMFLGFYQDGFPLVRLYCSLFWSVFKKKCSAFADKVESISIPDEMWIFQWFICFYIYNFPIKYIEQIFTFILKYKGFAAIRIAIGIMMTLEPKFASISDQFEQQFVQCIQMLKDYDYCVKNIPLDNLLEIAQSISPKEIEGLLMKGSQNWYQNYFSRSIQERKRIYEPFLEKKQQERKQFFGKVHSGFSIITYERKRDSVQIIQNIEQRKVKRYFNLFSSVKQKPVHSFIKFQKRYSLNEDRLNGLVQSVIN